MIYFRCDGNSVIGGGHVMRCLSIANAFQIEKKNIRFVLSDLEFNDIIMQNGFDTIVLGTKYNDLASEVELLSSKIKSDAEIIIVDSYYADFKYLSEIGKLSKVVYIDDLFAFPYPVDLLINYNVYADENRYVELYKNSGVKVPKLVLGTAYTPLRKEFVSLPDKKINDKIKDVLISTGVSDSLHLTYKLIKELKENGCSYHYHFIVGGKNNDIDIIEETAKEIKNVSIYYKCNNVCDLMQKCDVAVSAAGSTLYELCSTGTPIISYVCADNQIYGINEFEKRDLLISLGDVRKNDFSLNVVEAKIKLLSDSVIRKEYSTRIRQTVDGKGAKRIADFIRNFN